MHRNDLFLLLSKLSKKEVKDFDLFLKRNTTKTSIPNRLLTYIRKHHPDFSPNKVTFEKAHAFVFKTIPFNKISILNAISDIRKELKRYLVYRFQDDFSTERDFILLQFYRERALSKHFEKQLGTIHTELKKTKKQEASHWLQEMQLAHERYYHINTDRVKNYRAEIFNAMDNLDLFYTAMKLKYSSEVYNGYQILKESEPNIRLLPEIEQSDWYSHSRFHHCYKIVLQMVRERDESLFHRLKNIVFEEGNYFSKKDLYILITYLLNHTSYEIRKGKDDFVEESFELVKFAVDQQVFIINDVFDPIHFLNIIDIAGRLQQLEWAKEFVQKWSNKLEPSTKAYYTLFYQALIEFRMENFEACSDLLAIAGLKEPQTEIRGKWLEIASHYEINSPENFILNQCTAFEKFIRRNQLLHDKRKKGALLSIRIMRMLLKIDPDKNKMIEMLNNADDFHYKGWLLQKVEAL